MTAELLDELAGPPRPLGLGELIAVIGGLVHLERGAQARLGRLSVDEAAAPPAVRAWAAGAGLAHAWRADQLAEVLPVSATLPASEELVTSAGPLADRFLDELVPENALSWYETLATAYRRRLHYAQAAAEPFVARTLHRLLADLALVGAPPDRSERAS